MATGMVEEHFKKYEEHTNLIRRAEEELGKLKNERQEFALAIHAEVGSQTFEVGGEYFKVIKKSDGSAFVRAASPAKPKDAAE